MENHFLIIGQGLAGSLLAYDMYKAGLQFTIVSDTENRKESDIITRMYNTEVFERLAKTWLVDEVLQVMTNLYKNIEKDLGQQFLYPMDIVNVQNENEINVWDERIFDGDFSNFIDTTNKNWVKRGIDNLSLFDRTEKSGYVNLSKLLKGLKNFFKANGNLVEANFNYKDIGFINGDITWRGIRSKTIIFCEGHYATRNPYFKNVPFTPTKGELIEIECKELSEDYIIDKDIFVMPIEKHRFKVGTTQRFTQPGEEYAKDNLDQILSRLDELISLPYTVLNHWSGIRSAISDDRPVLGVHPHNQNIAIFNGLGSKGVMLAPYFAREMVYSLVNKNYILSKDVDIRRFLD
ncbi:FAD-dependent oxidoreductase [Marinifilum sp. N1E240]|uniref:NAD(P)/FAD-dependent oxidoreductase n=1 Tax=Marinifilum sp. N1E240 TaxID=2608082 RepID=UPI00128B4C85|nr:FAD-dependent oxidoreductase [Marinifilum sp. N1E240]MPQ49233.1 FAD-dependent oxidoreductase [Marinifilum sp. N1E240]